MTEAASPSPAAPRQGGIAAFVRFGLAQRIEHGVLLVTFTTLGLTGLVQKYAAATVNDWLIGAMGGIETTRLIHRTSAVVLLVEATFHVLAGLYRIYVLRTPLTMLPVMEDFKHFYQDVMFYIGRRKRKAVYGRYSYAEKVEYLAVVWGTVIMAITGFMMWNPLAASRWFTGEAIPAAKAAHGGEAVLAVLAIILWHFYHVHIRHLNKSMFTGRLTREEMHDEHPAELAELEGPRPPTRPAPDLIRRRQRVYYPVAALMAVAAAFGIFKFTTFEVSAVGSIPQAETAQVFVPQTPTPTLPPAPSATPAASTGLTSWDGGVGALLTDRCGACHGSAAMSGLKLTSYADALKGGSRGPAIVPGSPDSSVLVKIQSVGNHPGQLSEAELASIVQWIEAGAPEH
jgi:cytochrome b subunit of formate dehydrogenase/mono/diheme cytochrome c family protein